MRFGSPWVGPNNARATVAQGSWDPLIDQFQRNQHYSPRTIKHTSAQNAMVHIYNISIYKPDRLHYHEDR